MGDKSDGTAVQRGNQYHRWPASGLCIRCGGPASGGKGPGPGGTRPLPLFGLFGRKDDFVIPWNCIRRIGSDIILVELEPDKCRVPRPKPRWF